MKLIIPVKEVQKIMTKNKMKVEYVPSRKMYGYVGMNDQAANRKKRMENLQHFGIGIDRSSRNDMVGYHGTANADKVVREGFDFNKANYIKGTVFLGTTPEEALFWTGVKYGEGKPVYKGAKTHVKMLPQDEKKILKVTIQNEDKYANNETYTTQLNNRLVQRGSPPLPWYGLPYKKSNYDNLKAVRRAIVPALKQQGYRGAIYSNDKEIQVYYPEDIKKVERYK